MFPNVEPTSGHTLATLYFDSIKSMKEIMATHPKILADHPKVKAIRSSIQKAHLAFLNKTFVISRGQAKQYDLLAIRFYDASAGFQASIGGAHLAMGCADLTSIPPTSMPGASLRRACQFSCE